MNWSLCSVKKKKKETSCSLFDHCNHWAKTIWMNSSFLSLLDVLDRFQSSERLVIEEVLNTHMHSHEHAEILLRGSNFSTAIGSCKVQSGNKVISH